MDDAISRKGTSAWLENMGYSYPAKVIMDEKRFPSVLGTNLAEVGTDCISRQAAIEAVQNRHMMLSKEKVLLINDLEKLPSAQPEIIYCGECTKMKVDSVFHDCWCSETGKKVWINHYCGYAERREVTT